MSNTQHAAFRFTAKEGQPSANGANDAKVFLVLEPMTNDLDVFKGGYLSINLKPGIDVEMAQEISRLLNSKVSTVGFTEL